MPKILVADDDDGYRFPIVNLLQDAGFEVVEASDMEGVLKVGRDVDVRLVDVRLPTSRMEGILAIQKLASEGCIFLYPVFFISVIPESLASRELEVLKKHSIRYEWIEKPVELEYLLQRITKALEDKQ